MRRLGFVGDSRLQAAQKLLPDTLTAWHSQWCFRSPEALVESCCYEEASISQDPAKTPAKWLKADTDHGDIWLLAMNDSDWRQLLFAQLEESVPHDATAEHLIRRARQALVNAVLESLGMPPCDAFRPAQEFRLGEQLTRRVVVELCFSDSTPPLLMLVDAKMLDAHLPSVPPAAPLIERQEAIKTAKVSLRLSLPLAAIPLGELEGLQVGDVLRSTTRLDQPLTVALGEKKEVVRGYLARSDDKLALQLIN